MHGDPLVRLFLAIVVIVATSRAVGALFERAGQPAVMGEIVAGILLGPSGLGAIAPGATATLFAPDTLPALQLLAQLGLVFFMFLVGLEADVGVLRSHARVAAAVSLTSIAVPFVLGVGLALTVLQPFDTDPGAAGYEMFLGVAMSITALPVLARILAERRLLQTPLGTVALACASLDDFAAWCLLAASIAVTRTEGPHAVIATVVAIVAYGAVMATAGRRALALLARETPVDAPDTLRLSGVWVVVLLSAVATQAAGLDVIFGGFVAGLCMPRGTRMAEAIETRTREFVATLLLPIFFASSGLATRLDVLETPGLAVPMLAVLLCAVAGKYLGAVAGARATGMPLDQASALGVMMNTRGLTELVVLNVGLGLHVIGPEVFTLFVVMALATTLMAGPLLNRHAVTRRAG